MLNTSRLPSKNILTRNDTGIVRVLMAIASPTDLTRLDLQKQEAIQLQAELQRHITRSGDDSHQLPKIELTILDQPGREELTQALEQGGFHILHYSGHSNFGANGGKIYLVSKRTGLTETLSGDDLAGLLVNNNIQMAVFNSCLGVYSANSNAGGDSGESNLTESLVKRGLRSVLAMSERIPDEVALTLTQLFYRNLSQGYPLDLCVSRVRQGLISAYGSHQIYWALPILYLQREFDGFLSPENNFTEKEEFLNDYQPSLLSHPLPMYSDIIDELEIPLVSEESIPSGLLKGDFDTDWLEDDNSNYDNSNYDDSNYDDSNYDDDDDVPAFVGDVLRQLGYPQGTTELSSFQAELDPYPDSTDVQLNSESEQTLVFEPVPTRSSHLSDLSTNEEAASVPTSVPTLVKKPTSDWKWPLIGLTGVGLVAVVMGINMLWQNRPLLVIADIPKIPTQTLVTRELPPIDLKTANTGIVTAIATAKISQGDISSGLEAVEALLDRRAYANAQTALNLVDKKQIDQPEINFVRGRLAWELIQTGDKKYSIDDVRRFWEIAVKNRPDSLLYNNALGFAYYAEQDLNRANDSWFKAIDIALKTHNSQPHKTGKIIIPPEALTSYAGLALGLYKSAKSGKNQIGDKQEQYFNKAVNLRSSVVEQDPVNFQIQRLAHNWLWTPQAITDWQSLLEEKAEPR